MTEISSSQYLLDALKRAHEFTEPQRRAAIEAEHRSEKAIRAFGGSTVLYFNWIGTEIHKHVTKVEAVNEATDADYENREFDTGIHYEGTIRLNRDGTWDFIDFVRQG